MKKLYTLFVILNSMVLIARAQIISLSDTAGAILISPKGILGQTNGNSSLNVGLGSHALRSITTGHSNVGIGKFSLYSNTSGNQNSALGTNTLENNTTGNYNVAIGQNALMSNTSGSYNIGIGFNALKSNIGPTANFEGNIAIGFNALSNATSTRGNTSIGYSSMNSLIVGNENTGIGEGTMGLMPIGHGNTAIGSAAMYNAKNDVQKNVAIGVRAGERMSGGFNTFLGFESGALNVGSGNVFLGALSGLNEAFANVNSRLIIENSGSSDPLIYGEFDNKILKINGKLLLQKNNGVPASSTAPGSEGQLAFDDQYFYICIQNNVWKRFSLSSW